MTADVDLSTGAAESSPLKSSFRLPLWASRTTRTEFTFLACSLRRYLPELTLDQWLRTAEFAGGLMVIVFAESWGSIRSLALRRGDSLVSNRELMALGATNLASGAFQGMAVGAGFSASSANEAAGAQSKSAGLAAAGAVLMLAVFGTHLIELTPEPVLAAAVISALLHALNPKPLLALWRLRTYP